MSAKKSSRGRTRNVALNTVLVIIIVAACVGGYLAYGAASSEEGAVAVVTDGDGNVYELPLDTDTTLTVTTELGTNVIKVADGAVCVEEADCPNQDCVLQGWVSTTGEQIVCLPHELIVEIVGAEESGYDVIGS